MQFRAFTTSTPTGYELILMHTNGRHWLGPQKRTGVGPVHSPAAVTIPLQKHSKQPNHAKSNRTHTNTTKQKTRTKKAKWKVTVIIDEGEVIALYELRCWYGKTKKRENTETQKSHCHTVE